MGARRHKPVKMPWKVRNADGVIIARSFSVQDAITAAINNGENTSVSYKNGASLWTFSGSGIGKSQPEFVLRVMQAVIKRKEAQRFEQLVKRYG